MNSFPGFGVINLNSYQINVNIRRIVIVRDKIAIYYLIF